MAVCLLQGVINCAPDEYFNVMTDTLNADAVINLMQQAGVTGCELRLFDQIDSTNDWLLQQCRAGARLPLACVADAQSAGRGRRGKVWHSSPGENLAMSLGWRFEIPLAELGVFSLLMGVALVRALKQAGVTQAKLKWPNDVLVNNKKLAGILIETVSLEQGAIAVVAGFGVNCNMPVAARAQVDQAVTDVCEQSACGSCDRNLLAALILVEAIQVCADFPNNTMVLIDEYRREYDVLQQRAIMIQHDNGEQQSALALCVETNGALRVQVEGGELLLNAGTVSLRCGA
jgi:BirA family biotin operon repressor/biotin-[acetyl-CoA-carboxylase] ligase